MNTKHTTGARPPKGGGTPFPPPTVPAPDPQPGQLKYQARLAELGLPQAPLQPARLPVRQFQLAHIAATLNTTTRPNTAAAELAAHALAIWNASGRAMHIEQQAAVLAAGLLFYNAPDWQAHALALVGLLDALDGSVPGHTQEGDEALSFQKAQTQAGRAVEQIWRHGPGTAATLRALFPHKAETPETRAHKLTALLHYSAAAVASSDALRWHATDGDFLKASIREAWAPLRAPRVDLLDSAAAWARTMLAHPSGAQSGEGPSCNPLTARWLAVMRQDQLAAAKSRT